MKLISTSRSTSVCATSLLLLFLCTVPSASAQLELNQDGHVGVGQAPDSEARLAAEAATATPLLGTYTGTEIYGSAIRGYATATAGKGIGGYFEGGLYGFYGKSALSGSGKRHGVIGIAEGGSEGAIGVLGTGRGGTSGRYGLYGVSYTSTGSGMNAGVYARTQPSDPNDAGATRYTFYASAGQGTGTHYAGYFSGAVHVTGTLTYPSDARFKEAVEPLAGQELLEKVGRLRPASYRYKQDAVGRRMGFSDGVRFGFLAQELEAVFPEVVREQTHLVERFDAAAPGSGEGVFETVAQPVVEEVSYKAVNYVDLIPVLVGAIQEQQAEIAALKEALAKLGVTVE